MLTLFRSAAPSAFFRRSACTLLVLYWLVAATGSLLAQPTDVAKLNYRIIETRNHDTALFTQGFAVEYQQQTGYLLESSGGYGESLVRRYRVDSGETVAEKRLADALFAEGLTILGKHIYLLTWRKGKLLILERDSLSVTSQINYRGEGWGLTHDEQFFYMSDGSERIQRRSHNTFTPIDSITVSDGQRQYRNLNELEYARHSLWANIWHQSVIVRINPQTGAVTGLLDLSELVERNTRDPRATLNGIAYDPQRDAFWVTGKLWPNRYLIEITEPEL